MRGRGVRRFRVRESLGKLGAPVVNFLRWRKLSRLSSWLADDVSWLSPPPSPSEAYPPCCRRMQSSCAYLVRGRGRVRVGDRVGFRARVRVRVGVRVRVRVGVRVRVWVRVGVRARARVWVRARARAGARDGFGVRVRVRVTVS